MVLPKTDYDFYSSSNGTVPFTLYVWGMKDGVELPRERYNLSFDEYGVCDQELSYVPADEKEPLMLSRSSVLVHVGNSTPIDVIFGRVGSIRSEDSTIAAGWTYTNEQPPYSFTVTQHTDAYLREGWLVASVTRVTRYELTDLRSRTAVAKDLSQSGWTTD